MRRPFVGIHRHRLTLDHRCEVLALFGVQDLQPVVVRAKGDKCLIQMPNQLFVMREQLFQLDDALL
jgi:hypothetical protein